MKTQKSKLIQAVENKGNSLTVFDLSDGENVCVLDAFAIFQSLTAILDSFGETVKTIVG